ncbi:MAG: hypothetical protein PSY12_11465 [bacterium]|nr:hypothetical protein [bacterium]
MNLPDSWFVPDACTEIAGEPTFAENCTTDDNRLVHHSTIIEMNGESYRKRSAVARITAGDYDPPNGTPDRPS